MNIFRLNAMLEIHEEILELRALGLTEEEIQGYIEFFMDNWLDPLNKIPGLKVTNVKH